VKFIANLLIFNSSLPNLQHFLFGMYDAYCFVLLLFWSSTGHWLLNLIRVFLFIVAGILDMALSFGIFFVVQESLQTVKTQAAPKKGHLQAIYRDLNHDRFNSSPPKPRWA
jgi:hypothetical protein